MKINKLTTTIVLVLSLSIGGAFAQVKGAEQLMKKSKTTASTTETNVSYVNGNGKLLQSHIKSLGTVGKSGRYEIISARQRGLDSPNNSTLFVYDNNTDELSVVASSGGAGLGGAIVQASGYAVGQYLTFSKYEPDQNNINSGNSGGGTSVSATVSGGNTTANATGGAGGLGGSSTATGGAATGGTATGGSATGGTSTSTSTSTGGTFTGGTRINGNSGNNPSPNN